MLLITVVLRHIGERIQIRGFRFMSCPIDFERCFLTNTSILFSQDASTQHIELVIISSLVLRLGVVRLPSSSWLFASCS